MFVVKSIRNKSKQHVWSGFSTENEANVFVSNLAHQLATILDGMVNELGEGTVVFDADGKEFLWLYVSQEKHFELDEAYATVKIFGDSLAIWAFDLSSVEFESLDSDLTSSRICARIIGDYESLNVSTTKRTYGSIFRAESNDSLILSVVGNISKIEVEYTGDENGHHTKNT